MNKFDFVVTKKWPSSVIRCKGSVLLQGRRGQVLCLRTGRKADAYKHGCRTVVCHNARRRTGTLQQQNPALQRDWDDEYGDRMQKLVFIGQHMNREEIERELDYCLA